MRQSANFFFIAMICGAITMLIGLFGIFLDGSPYQSGRVGLQWLPLELASSLLLIYSGGFGLNVCRVDIKTAPHYRMSIFWNMLLFILFMWIFGIWSVFEEPFETPRPEEFLDIAAIAMALITAVLSLPSLALCLFYGVWVHRLRAATQPG